MNHLIELRRVLHRSPELSGQEYETQKRIKAYIQALNPTSIQEVAGTGLLVHFHFGGESPSFLVRADLDALPIDETNDFEHKSTVAGVAHKCGHDGHSTILCGLAERLTLHPLDSGNIYLLFQPAEENGHGAKAVLADAAMKMVNPEFCFALHNLPGYPLHQVVYKPGLFTPAVKSIIIKLVGKTSHAAEPENGTNPALALAECIQVLEALNVTDIEKDDFCVSSPIYMNMGEKAYGTTAGSGEVHYTIRTWSNDVMNKYTRAAVKEIEAIARKYRLKLKIDWTEEFAANENDEEAIEIIKMSAKENGYELYERKEPMKWGEDFGLFTKKFRGAMFGIGAGKDHPALHNPDYDFPDEIIETGVNMFYHILKKSLQKYV